MVPLAAPRDSSECLLARPRSLTRFCSPMPRFDSGCGALRARSPRGSEEAPACHSRGRVTRSTNDGC
eukprot:8863947-Pyramimonas_sp.AAC.1